MYRIECYDAHGHVVAVASEMNGSLVVQGDMNAWRETAGVLKPLIDEAAAGYEAPPSDQFPA